ncbi:hypothetical protein WN55_05891, partial [Dufourea novaeangliae]
FRSAIHENSSLRETQKLSYLRSCLTGKATEKIESLETTSANYLVAWNILEKYYHDPSVLINNRIQAMFELPTQIRYNVDSFGELVDQATKHYRALQALNVPFLEAFSIYTIVSKLDEDTQLKWRERLNGNALPSMEDLFDFIHSRRKLLESKVERSNKGKFTPHPRTDLKHHTPLRSNRNPNFTYTAIDIICNLCKEKHYTSSCSKLKNISVSQRLDVITNANLCINCLRPNHVAKNCLSSSCKQCKGRHHTILHREPNIERQVSTQVNVPALSASVGAETLLSTAVIYLVDNKGQQQPCRVLLDSGSESHFLTERIARKLGLPLQVVDIPVSGINNGVTKLKHSVKTKFHSRINNFLADITFLIIPHITETLSSRVISRSELTIPKNLPLADPNFHSPSEIDGLIGTELFLQLLCIGQIKLSNSAVVLQKNKLVWVLAGKVSDYGVAPAVRCNVTRENIHEKSVKFWEIEEISFNTTLSEEDR